MKKLLLAALAALILLPAALFAASYFARVQEQRRADESLRLLHLAPATFSAGGDALFLLDYNTPDAATRRQWLAQYGSNALRGVANANTAPLPDAIRAAQLPDAPLDRLACPLRDSVSGCLAAVRDNLPAYRTSVQQAAQLLANADALAQYDNFDYVINDLTRDALPRFAPLVQQHTAAAVDWAENRHETALARVCRNIHTGRVLLRAHNGLIDTMVGNAIVARNTALAAEMLAEQPAWATHLPDNCAAAFAPFAHGEPNLCAAMQGEFRYFDGMMRNWLVGDMQGADENENTDNAMTFVQNPVAHSLLFSPEHTRRLHAQNLAHYCTAESQTAVAQDRQPENAPPAQNTRNIALRPACWGNFIGYVLLDNDTANYNVYSERLLDTAMQQRAFQAALALYALPPAQRRAALPQILQQHSSPARKLSYNETTRQITFTRYDQRENAAAQGVAVNVDG